MSNNDGGKFIMLDRLFNPAGVPNPEDRDTVILSMFEPRENDGGGGGGFFSSGHDVSLQVGLPVGMPYRQFSLYTHWP